MIESRACPECGAQVPAGRLSCGACGALLASVDRQEPSSPAMGRGAPTPRDPDGASAARATAEPGPAPIADAAAIVQPLVPPGAAPTATAIATASDARPALAPADVPPDVASADVDAAAKPASVPPAVASADVIAAMDPADVPPAVPDAPLPLDAPTSASAQPPAIAELDEIRLPRPPMPPIPGAYLAPSAIMRSAPIVTTHAAPAAAPPGPGPVSTPPARGAEPIPPGGPKAGAPARVPVLELPFAIAPGIGPRLVAGGSVLAVLAFVLPWVPDGGVVIGGASGGGYFATWGLAAIGNILPFLAAWVCLVLAVLPNRVPRFAALGVLPLLLGGIFVGLGWTYLIAPFGAAIGIWALAVGALLLVVGAILVLRDEDPAR